MEMDDELQRLREQVEQLQTENERLCVSQRAGAGDAQPVRRDQALYIPRERKCPKFSGSMSSGALSIEEWIEEAQSCIRSKHMSDFDKAMFLYDHLEGEARNEIKYRPSAIKESHLEILTVLQEIYGCGKSYVYWQQCFFDRRQKEGESLFEFSHALMELMGRVKQCNRGSIANADMVLRDQFCENVMDHALRRELKRLVRANAQLSLLDVRQEAIRWLEEDRPSRSRSQRMVVRNSDDFISQCDSVTSHSSELAELKHLVLKQQAQLDMLTRHLAPPKSNPRTAPARDGRFRRTRDGQPVCLRCNQPGHIARYCQTNLPPPPPNGRPVNSVPSGRVNSQSEN